MMNLANAPTMPKSVTDTVIGSVDLGPEIGVNDRQLRTRRLVVQPGGVVPLHSHKDRPALIYTLSGSITEYSSACGAPIEHKAGDISREADGLSHYWVNNGSVPAVLLSSDVHHGM
jgi:quercetin dioxygenase-like cupin family protein